MFVKHIESLEMTFVHMNQLIKFQSHVLFAKIYILIIIVVTNIVLHVHASVM